MTMYEAAYYQHAADEIFNVAKVMLSNEYNIPRITRVIQAAVIAQNRSKHRVSIRCLSFVTEFAKMKPYNKEEVKVGGQNGR